MITRLLRRRRLLAGAAALLVVVVLAAAAVGRSRQEAARSARPTAASMMPTGGRAIAVVDGDGTGGASAPFALAAGETAGIAVACAGRGELTTSLSGEHHQRVGMTCPRERSVPGGRLALQGGGAFTLPTAASGRFRVSAPRGVRYRVVLYRAPYRLPVDSSAPGQLSVLAAPATAADAVPAQLLTRGPARRSHLLTTTATARYWAAEDADGRVCVVAELVADPEDAGGACASTSAFAQSGTWVSSAFPGGQRLTARLVPDLTTETEVQDPAHRVTRNLEVWEGTRASDVPDTSGW